MKSTSFEYIRPANLDEATAALGKQDGECRILGGGQTLAPILNMRLASPACIIDVGRIASLKRISQQGNNVVIGSGVTHATIEDSTDLSPTWRLLSYVASTIAYRAIRNRGTIGGSLAHADPAADWITTMVLLDARLTIAGPSGKRVVAMSNFMKGAFTTVLKPTEILEAIEIANLSPGALWGYYRICRKIGEFPDAVGAVVLDRERKVYQILVGALDGVPVLLPSLAECLARDGEAAAAPPLVIEAVRAAAPDLDAVDLQLHAAAVRRAILQAVA